MPWCSPSTSRCISPRSRVILLTCIPTCVLILFVALATILKLSLLQTLQLTLPWSLWASLSVCVFMFITVRLKVALRCISLAAWTWPMKPVRLYTTRITLVQIVLILCRILLTLLSTVLAILHRILLGTTRLCRKWPFVTTLPSRTRHLPRCAFTSTIGEKLILV